MRSTQMSVPVFIAVISLKEFRITSTHSVDVEIYRTISENFNLQGHFKKQE